MDAAERAYFEELRKNTPEIDQMVVEHGMFLHQMDFYAAHRTLKHSIHESHARLLARGDINEGTAPSAKGRVIQLWNKYKKVTAIAASVGGIIAIGHQWPHRLSLPRCKRQPVATTEQRH